MGAPTNTKNVNTLLPIETAIGARDNPWQFSYSPSWYVCKKISQYTPPEQDFVCTQTFHRYWPYTRYFPSYCILEYLKVQSLIAAGADPNARCPTSRSLLSAACYNAGLDGYPGTIINILIKASADESQLIDNDGKLATMIAHESSEERIGDMRLFLEAGADPNVEGGSLWTPMTAAGATHGKNSIQVMELLHQAGTDINTYGGIHGTALIAAANAHAFRSKEKIWKLIEWDTDLSLPGPNGTFAEIASRHSVVAMRSRVLDSSETLQILLDQALIAAAAIGNIDTMVDLVSRGANVNAELEFLGDVVTPIVAATSSHGGDNLEGDNVQKVQLLVSYGANINTPALQYRNLSQMHVDCKEPDLPLIQFLLDAGIDVNASPGGRGTAFEIAVRAYHKEGPEKWDWQKVIAILCQSGATLVDDELFSSLLRHERFPEILTGQSSNHEESFHEE